RAAQAWAAPARMARDARERRHPLGDGGLTPASGASVPARISTTPPGSGVAPPIESTRWGSPDPRRHSTTPAARSAGSSRAPRPAGGSPAREAKTPRTAPGSAGAGSAARGTSVASQLSPVHTPTFQAPDA